MNSRLAGVPIGARRRLAATLGLFTMLFVAVGAVAATGGGTVAAPVFSAVAFVLAVLLGLVAWGVAHSVKLDLAEQRLDRAIEDTMRAHGASTCACGHDHDPNELHVRDECAHDGTGAACDTCVLRTERAK